MYVMTCVGGYPMPARAGKFEVLGFRATLSAGGTNARVTLIDDVDLPDSGYAGKTYPNSDTKRTPIIDVRSLGGTVGNLEVMFPEPIKVRKGISICGWDNILVGSGMLYYR